MKKSFELQGSWYSNRLAQTNGFKAKIGSENMHQVPKYYFSNPIVVLKPGVRTGPFEYHEFNNPNFTEADVRLPKATVSKDVSLIEAFLSLILHYQLNCC